MSSQIESARLAAIIEDSFDVILCKDLDGYVTSWNAAAERLYGYAADEVIGRHISFLAPDRPEEFRDIMRRLRRGERVEQLETVRYTKDGRRLDVSVTVSPIRDETGRIVAASTIARDITQRKHREAETAREHRVATTLYRLAPSIVAELDPDRLAQRVVDEAIQLGQADVALWMHAEDRDERSRGFRSASAGEPLGSPGPAAEELLHMLARHLRPGRPISISNVESSPDAAARAARRLLSTTTQPVCSVLAVPVGGNHDHHERAASVLLLGRTRLEAFSDEHVQLLEGLATQAALATENADLYRALQDADRRKELFFAILGHELRNPLAAIQNAVNLFPVEELPEDSVTRRAGDIIARQVDRALHVVNELMDVTRLRRGSIWLQRVPVTLAELVQRSMESAAPYLRERGHQVEARLPDDTLWLNVDVLRMVQVLDNLLHNAAKYTEPGGRIELHAELTDDALELRVQDNGRGIPADLLPHVFDLFAQHRADRTPRAAGLGLGLSLVRSLVELHDGRVDAWSRGEGLGTEMRIRLPRDCVVPAPERQAASAEAAHRDGPAEATPRRVLVVDDSVDSAETIAMYLRKRGHRVWLAHDGAQCLDLCEARAPDLVLLDLGLPDIDGFEVAERIRRRFDPDVPCLVALTGYADDEHARRCLDAGFFRHMPKPVNLDELSALIRESCRLPATEGAVDRQKRTTHTAAGGIEGYDRATPTD